MSLLDKLKIIRKNILSVVPTEKSLPTTGKKPELVSPDEMDNELDLLLEEEEKKRISKLNRNKLKLPYVAMLPISAILISLYIMNIANNGKGLPEEETIVTEVDAEANEEEQDLLVESNLTLEEAKPLAEPSEDCILWQNIPDESEFVEFSNVFYQCGREVVIAYDEYGTSFLLDANDHSNLLFGNFISYAGPYHRGDDYVFVILSVDGYHYQLSAEDFRTVVSVESAYSYESEPFYLDGYGYVIEAENCGEKYLIDAETRYAFIRNFDDYEPMYYDEEFDCYVYCFNKYGGSSKYYLAAEDLRRVLKIENSWDKN